MKNNFDGSGSATASKDFTKSYRPIRIDAVPVREESARKYIAVYAENNTAVSVADWITLLSSDQVDRGSIKLAQSLTKIMKEAPFEAFRFETPAVSPETVFRTPFEFVLVRDTYLVEFAATPNPNPFSQFLFSPPCKTTGDAAAKRHEPKNSRPAGCVFANLGGDAMLIAPTDWSSSSSSPVSSCYGHLANFVRGAPEEQVTGLWRTVAETLAEQLIFPKLKNDEAGRKRPLWLSTAGDGVAWLHFRLDSRPKYYHYRPYMHFVNEE